MKEQDQHDSAFKGIMEHVLPKKCVRTIAGPEVAKFPLRVDLITERQCPAPSERGIVAWLINNLPPYVIYEFKGPTDTLQEDHIWRLVSYCGLFAMEKKITFFDEGIAAVLIYVGVSKRLQETIDSQTQEIIPGVKKHTAIMDFKSLQLLFIDVNQLEIKLENLPFLMFRVNDLNQIVDLIYQNSTTKKSYGYTIYKIQRKDIQQILKKKGIDVTEVAPLRELIEDFGAENIIREIGLK
ncbi:MAG: hypothetical protein ACTSYL_03370 [Candidatus Thorarchaeota archaeon]